MNVAVGLIVRRKGVPDMRMETAMWLTVIVGLTVRAIGVLENVIL
jgi:hypothetical protein